MLILESVINDLSVSKLRLARSPKNEKRRMLQFMDYEPTSAELDLLLDAEPDVGERLPPQPEMRVHVEVALDHETLEVLQARADREGRPFAEVVSDAVRAGAAAA